MQKLDKDNLPMDIKERGPDQVAKFLVKWPTRCLDHVEPVSSFCVDHNKLICNVCNLTNHSACQSIMGLAEAARGVKSSRECALLDGALKKQVKQYEKLIGEQTDILDNVTEQDRNFVKDVQFFRSEINTILDKLEYAILAKKDNFVAHRKQLIKNHRHACKSAKTMLEHFNKELDRSFLSPDDQQLFIVLQKTKTVLSHYEEQLTQIQQTPKRVTILFQPNRVIEKFFLTLGEFGSMKLDEKSEELIPPVVNKSQNRRLSLATSERLDLKSTLSSRSERIKSSLPLIGTSLRSGNQPTPRTRRPLPQGEVEVSFGEDTEVPFITGIAVMPDDQVALADDANKSVKLLNQVFRPVSSIQLTTPPNDVTPIKVTSVAVTLTKEKAIQFIDVGKHMVLRQKLQLDIECTGITCYENELYVTTGFSKDREIQIVSFKGEVRKRYRPGIVDLRYPLYIVVDPMFKTIFVTDYNHGVIGLDVNSGKVKFKCKDTDVHGYYKGIALGHKGNMYVCTWNLHGVSRVHLDGRGLETVIPMPDKEGRKPLAADYSKKTNQLIVTMSGKKRGCLALFKYQ